MRNRVVLRISMKEFLADFLIENFTDGSHILVVSVSQVIVFEKVKNLFHFTFLYTDPQKEDIADRIPLVPNIYDGIIVMDWLEYCLWKRWAVQKFHYLLKPNGKLLIYTPLKSMLIYLNQVLSAIKRTKPAGGLSFCFSPGYIPLHLRSLVKSQNFLIHRQILFCFFFCGFRLHSQYKNLTRTKRFFNKIKAGLSLLCGESVLLSCQKKNARQEPPAPLSEAKIQQQIKAFEYSFRNYFSDRREWLAKNPSYSNRECVSFDPDKFSRRCVLFFSPHPDDEVIGCGGLIQRLVQSGARVVILQVTDGTDSRAFRDCPGKIDRQVRLEESKQVAERLQVNHLILWNYPGESYPQAEDAIEKYIHVLQTYQPALIGAPFVNDPHPIHRSVNHYLKTALERIQETGEETSILQYEVWSLVPPNTYCIIDEQFNKKTELLMQYQTGMKAFDYVAFCRQKNSYQSLHLLSKPGYIECFLKVTIQEYLKINPMNTQ